MIVAITFLPAVAMPVMADGMSWEKQTTSGEAWAKVHERSQFAIINYQDRLEKMIVSIQVNADQLESASEMFWLFPVPSDPTDVSVDVMSIVPRLDGEPLGEFLQDEVADSPLWMLSLGTTIWFAGMYGMVLTLGGTGAGGGGAQDVVAYDSISKNGLTTSVLSANTSADMQGYFQLNGMTIPSEDLALIDEYIEDGFAFVATRISDVAAFRSSASAMSEGGITYYMMGVEADFRTDRIFFPLKLTSGYGDAEIPIVVQVLGLVEVTGGPPESQSLSVDVDYEILDGGYLVYGNSYYYGPSYSNFNPEVLPFFEEQIGSSWRSNLDSYSQYSIYDQRFTTIRIDGRADALDQDLWMADSAPFAEGVTDAMIQNSGLVVVIAVVIISMLTGIIAGLIVDRNSGHLPQYMVIGLCNVLTAVATVAAYHSYRKKWLKEKGSPPRGSEAPKNMWAEFFMAYTIIFIGIVALFWMAISL
jgi:hypothetical protein